MLAPTHQKTGAILLQPRTRLFYSMIPVLAALFVSGYFILSPTTPPTGQIEIITRGAVEEAITAQGKLEPKSYVDLGAQVSGQLEKLHVSLGDMVKAGDLVAEIDSQLFAAQVAGDEARLKTLEAQFKEQTALVDQAALVMKRNSELLREKAVSQELLEQSQTDYTVAVARREALTAQIEEASSTLEGNKAKLTFTRIYSPMAGTVVSQTAREGETLNANQVTPTIMQVADLNTMTVRAQVAEADIPRLHPGMLVYFTTLGSQGRRWEATVRQILPTPEVINDVVLFNVLVDVDNQDRALMPQMSAQMFFVLGRATDVPLVPVAALKDRLPAQDTKAGTAYQVYLLRDNRPVATTLMVGIRNRSVAEVKSGLESGDRILIPESTPAKAEDARRRRMPRL